MENKKILIADDEPHLVHILAYNLRRCGAIVETAKNGLECVSMASSYAPDLIVSDYQMPLLDGLQACMELRRNHQTSGIPIVMLTARGHRLTAAEVAQTNIKLLLPKPFSAHQLIAAIDTILNKTTDTAAA